MMKKAILSVTLAGVWIVISEFIRNEFILKQYWVDHYKSLGLTFDTLPINGILWTAWSFILSYLIFTFLKKFSFTETLLLAWLPAFLMMWFTIYNLQVLPLGLLIFAVPLSILEIAAAEIIITKLNNRI